MATPKKATTLLASASRKALQTAVYDALESLSYYRRQVVVRTYPAAILQAKGVVAAWETTLAARQEALRESTKS